MRNLILLAFLFTGLFTSAQTKVTVGSGSSTGTTTGTTDISGKVDKSSISVNAKDAPFNAVGNGIADDRAALQAAADFAQANKRRLYIPAGTYITTTSVGVGIEANLFLKPGADIFGDGDATVLQRSTSTIIGYAIALEKTSHNAAPLADRNYTIRNLKILGASTGLGFEVPIGSTERDGGIFIANAARSNIVVIENVTAERFNKEAIAVWDAVSLTMRNNSVINVNHDAYNPQVIERLIATGNKADRVSFGMEYHGLQSGGVPTTALIDGNSFTNVYEYGINIEAGDNVTISNNKLVGYEGTTSVTGVSVGIYIAPHVDTIGKLNITGNKIHNFIQYGIGTAGEQDLDFVVSNTVIKGNTITGSGSNAIHFQPKSTNKFGRIEISGNTLYNWNRVDNGNSFQWAAIDLNGINDVDVISNRFYNIINGKRNDPLRINNTANIKFIYNDVTGPPSQFNSTLQVLQQLTNTGVVIYGNEGLSGNSTPSTPSSFVNIRYLTTGTSYTPSTGTTKIDIHIQGAGGGGGGSTGTASNAAAGAGGGAGAYVNTFVTVSEIAYTIAIGTAGSGGTNAGGAGGTGGSSSITIGATTYTASGGLGGAGMTTGTSLLTTLGGSSGSGTNGSIIARGAPGTGGMRLSGTVAMSGIGGSSQFGGGGQQSNSSNAGVSGVGYGAGGGGATAVGAVNHTGGAGTAGIIIIYEYR